MDMGSKEIGNLGYREGFAFIGGRGLRDAVMEKRAKKSGSKVSVT